MTSMLKRQSGAAVLGIQNQFQYVAALCSNIAHGKVLEIESGKAAFLKRIDGNNFAGAP